MKPVLIDTGPLVALIDRGDQDHKRCVDALKEIRAPLVTTWPVITEAMHLLADVPAGQETLLGRIEVEDLRLADLNPLDVPTVRTLMRKYADLPMDFADASLVAIAQREGFAAIMTLDSDFRLYRRNGRRSFRLLPS